MARELVDMVPIRSAGAAVSRQSASISPSRELLLIRTRQSASFPIPVAMFTGTECSLARFGPLNAQSARFMHPKRSMLDLADRLLAIVPSRWVTGWIRYPPLASVSLCTATCLITSSSC